MHMKAIFAFVGALAFAILGPLLAPGFGGYDPSLFPIPQDNAPIVPAGYAFAIWGVIYTWLVISGGFGVFKRADAEDWGPMRWPLIASLVIGTPWLAVAMISPLWATVLIFAMLILALVAMDRAPVLDPWWARAPVSLYAGWLTAASFASLGILAAGHGVIFGQVGWALICLAGAFSVALIGHKMRPDAPLYPLGTAWALIAIVVRNWGTQWGVAAVAALAAVILLLLCAKSARRAAI